MMTRWAPAGMNHVVTGEVHYLTRVRFGAFAAVPFG